MQKNIFGMFYTIGSLIAFAFVIRYFRMNDVRLNADFFYGIESQMEKVFGEYYFIKEVYGATNILISPHEIVSDRGATIKYADGFLDSISESSFNILSAERKLVELRNFCDANGIDFTYISFPSKSDENTRSLNYGIETNQEMMRRDFLSGLRKEGIKVLDVRELLESNDYNKKDIFYKTDHHWKCPAGLFAARSIARYLNENFGYSLRADLLDEDLFSYITYDDLWFGETGRSLSKTWVGALDSFIEILPKYDTSFEIGSEYGSSDTSGDFTIMVDESGYSGDVDLYKYSAHYSYGKGLGSPTWIHNDNVQGQKILIVKDSFSMVVIPFLSLSTSDICVWDMRTTTESIYDYIESNDFDMVIVEYTDFWRDEMYAFN